MTFVWLATMHLLVLLLLLKYYFYSSSSMVKFAGNIFRNVPVLTSRVIVDCLLIRSWYRRQPWKRSSWVPTSTILWLSITTIWSAHWIVDNRCATTTTVRPIIALSIAVWTSNSDSASNAEVASSKSNIRQSVNNARAILLYVYVTRYSTQQKLLTCVQEWVESWKDGEHMEIETYNTKNNNKFHNKLQEKKTYAILCFCPPFRDKLKSNHSTQQQI